MDRPRRQSRLSWFSTAFRAASASGPVAASAVAPAFPGRGFPMASVGLLMATILWSRAVRDLDRADQRLLAAYGRRVRCGVLPRTEQLLGLGRGGRPYR